MILSPLTQNSRQTVNLYAAFAAMQHRWFWNYVKHYRITAVDRFERPPNPNFKDRLSRTNFFRGTAG